MRESGPSSLDYGRCEDPKKCPGHLGACTHTTGLLACGECIDERQRVRIVWCDPSSSESFSDPAQKGSEARPCRSGHTDCTVDCGRCKGTGREPARKGS